MTKKQVEEERVLGPMLPHHFLSINKVRTGTQIGRILEVGVDAEAMEGTA